MRTCLLPAPKESLTEGCESAVLDPTWERGAVDTFGGVRTFIAGNHCRP